MSSHIQLSGDIVRAELVSQFTYLICMLRHAMDSFKYEVASQLNLGLLLLIAVLSSLLIA